MTDETSNEEFEVEDIQASVRLTKPIKDAAGDLLLTQIRFLVSSYYQIQKYRISTCAQLRPPTEGQTRERQKAWEKKHPDKPFPPQPPVESYENQSLRWMADNTIRWEASLKSLLDHWSKNQPLGPWLHGIKGIGPVLAAGVLAHFDPTRPTAGAWWRFAGLDPTIKWKKGERRPFCAEAKVLCYKIGESFVKVQSKGSLYGELYRTRKDEMIAKNDSGVYADDAARILEEKNWSKGTESYKAYTVGQLPAGQLHQRARRYAVKIFLSHTHQTWRELLGLPVVAPYAIAEMGHAHFIPPSEAR